LRRCWSSRSWQDNCHVCSSARQALDLDGSTLATYEIRGDWQAKPGPFRPTFRGLLPTECHVEHSCHVIARDSGSIVLDGDKNRVVTLGSTYDHLAAGTTVRYGVVHKIHQRYLDGISITAHPVVE
jgi:hypothetical protein